MATDDIVALHARMRQTVATYEGAGSDALLDELNQDFQEFARLVTLFLVSERDTYYGYFLMSMTFRTNYACSTIAGIRLDQYPPVFETNPLILLKYSLREILYIFCHEVDHVVFGHPAEMVRFNPQKDPTVFKLFNYAADASVNDQLDRESRQHKFLKAPEGRITSQVIAREFGLMGVRPCESYLYYFNLIRERGDELPQDGDNGIAPIPGVDGSSNVGDGERDSGGVITAAQAAGHVTDHAWAGDEADETYADLGEAMAQSTKELMNEAAGLMGEEGRGHMPGRFTERLEAINRPPRLNWQAILKRYVGTVADGKEKTRTRLNRRQPRRHDLSGERESRTLKIVVAVDTSGSMSDEALRKAFGEILGIIARRKFELTVIECDMSVQRVYRIRGASDLPNHVSGRGGTSFTPVIRYVNEHRYFRDALLIYFTDGFGERSIPRPLTYRNLWVVMGNVDNLSVQEPYGMVLPLE